MLFPCYRMKMSHMRAVAALGSPALKLVCGVFVGKREHCTQSEVELIFHTCDIYPVKKQHVSNQICFVNESLTCNSSQVKNNTCFFTCISTELSVEA